MARRSRLALPVLVLCAATAIAGAGVRPATARAQQTHATQAQREQARQIALRGYLRFEAAEYREALALFQAAHHLYPNARLLRAIGKTYAALRRPVQALAALEAALRHPVARLDARLRADTEALLAEVRLLVGELTVRVRPGRSIVLVDGSALRSPPQRMRITAGLHRIEVRASGYLPHGRELTVQGGAEPTEIQVALQRDPAARRSDGPSGADILAPGDGRDRGRSHAPPWGWIAAGTGLAVVATTVVVVLLVTADHTPNGDPGSLGYVVGALDRAP